MAKTNSLVLGMLILQMYVRAAPSDVSKLDDVTQEHTGHTLDGEIAESPSETSGQRQKRWYPGYGFSSFNPFNVYPSNVKRDDSSETGVYGYEDPFVNIHRRLQEIAGFVSQPSFQPTPQLPPHFPLYFPVVYIPQAGCSCTPDTSTNQPPQPTNNKNETDPNVENRFPEMDDTRQNWGIVVNETDSENDSEEDVGRPISFVPIRLNRTMSRPAPPVEHGSVQAGSSDDLTTTAPFLSVQSISEQSPTPAVVAPSICDGAVLSCCHQAQVTYDCFALQGCPDPTAYGNPCGVNVILQVIERFQKFYGQRTG